jgi:NAD(P)-dependent dehydrogenase (short-subunit alcohol dehydrogenase family)
MAWFQGRAGYVTGGASGIGEAIAKRLASEGASLVVADVNDDGGTRVVEEIAAAGGVASYQHADVSAEADVRAVIDATVERYGGLRIAVNNVGQGQMPAPLHEVDVATYDLLMATNLRSMFLGMKFAIPHMLDGAGGSIVNTASGVGLKASKGLSVYTATKHGVVGLTRAAAIDYAEHGIRVNAVAPGTVATPQMLAHPPELLKQYEGLMPSGRIAKPSEIAAAVAWLLSDESSYVSGEVMPVDYAYLQSG